MHVSSKAILVQGNVNVAKVNTEFQHFEKWETDLSQIIQTEFVLIVPFVVHTHSDN
jgi:hypothetical protein